MDGNVHFSDVQPDYVQYCIFKKLLYAPDIIFHLTLTSCDFKDESVFGFKILNYKLALRFAL